jgi:hypothetical protein
METLPDHIAWQPGKMNEECGVGENIIFVVGVVVVLIIMIGIVVVARITTNTTNTTTTTTTTNTYQSHKLLTPHTQQHVSWHAVRYQDAIHGRESRT